MAVSNWLARMARRGPGCAVVTPVGPGHGELYRECSDSVKNAWGRNRGPFARLELIAIDDGRGELGRSRARNQGVREAQRRKADWVFFLDADDVMHPDAFASLGDLVDRHDGVWGLIATQLEGDSEHHVRMPQILSLDRLEQLVIFDPFLTLQMGHFVRTDAAAETPFNEDLDAGEDVDSYLRLWARYRCVKVPRIFGVARKGNRSTGPRPASPEQWNVMVRPRLAAERARLDLDPDSEKTVGEKNRCAAELQAFCRAHGLTGIDWREVAREMPFRGQCEITQYEGEHFVMYSDNDDAACLRLAWTGEYRDVSSRVWQQLAKRSRVIVDLGAGAGFYSLLAARVAPPEASIYCFEPDAGSFARLARNIESNRIGSIVAIHAALPDRSMRADVLASLSLARVNATSATREALSMVAEATGDQGPELLIETAPGAQLKAAVASLGGKGYRWFAIDDDSYRVYPLEDFAESEAELPALLWATTRPVEEAQELLQAAGASVV